jgi:hypothetical protein
MKHETKIQPQAKARKNYSYVNFGVAQLCKGFRFSDALFNLFVI